MSDPEKKKMYDSGQMEYDGDPGAGMGGFSNMSGGNVDPNEIFKMFFGGGGGGASFGGDDFGGFSFGSSGMGDRKSVV